MRPPFGYEGKTYIKIRKSMDDLGDVCEPSRADSEDEEITQPYTRLDLRNLRIEEMSTPEPIPATSNRGLAIVAGCAIFVILALAIEPLLIQAVCRLF